MKTLRLGHSPKWRSIFSEYNHDKFLRNQKHYSKLANYALHRLLQQKNSPPNIIRYAHCIYSHQGYDQGMPKLLDKNNPINKMRKERNTKNYYQYLYILGKLLEGTGYEVSEKIVTYHKFRYLEQNIEYALFFPHDDLFIRGIEEDELQLSRKLKSAKTYRTIRLNFNDEVLRSDYYATCWKFMEENSTSE